MYTLIDIHDNIIICNGIEIIIIMDDNNMPWFLASEITKLLLSFENTKEVIINNINDKYKKTLNELHFFLQNKFRMIQFAPPNGVSSDTIFINEYGLYEIIVENEKEIAVEYKSWLLDTVIPSIRKYSYDAFHKKNITPIKELEMKLKKNNYKIVQEEKRKIKYCKYLQCKLKYLEHRMESINSKK